MKKQYQIVILILVVCVFFCANRDNNPKACGKNTTACSAIQKNAVKKIPSDYIEEEDASLYMLMNPFIQ